MSDNGHISRIITIRYNKQKTSNGSKKITTA